MHEFLLPSGLVEGDPPYWYTVLATGSPIRVVILEPGGETDAFVSRYDRALAYVADSWHPTREDAIKSCEEEFGTNLGHWRPIPEEEADTEGYVFKAITG